MKVLNTHPGYFLIFFYCKENNDFSCIIENDTIRYLAFEPNLVVFKEHPCALETTGDHRNFFCPDLAQIKKYNKKGEQLLINCSPL